MAKNRRNNSYGSTLSNALQQGGFYNDKGLWNSLVKLDGRILRGRVETLVLKKDQQQVFMHIKNFNKHIYRIPGGSFEKDIPNYIQAANEVCEEARIKVKNVINTGQHYVRVYNNPIIIDSKDNNLKWHGSYNEVYIAEYDGPFEGHIDERDLDNDMAEKGQFYNIRDIYPILNETHKIIIDSIFPNITPSEISENYNTLSRSDDDPHYYPYYTPKEMHNLGVFNESVNRYSDIGDEAIEWYHEYTDTLVNGDSINWFKELSLRYDNYKKEPTLENKQLILNLGWNPEIPVTLSNILKASENTKKKLSLEATNSDIQTINEEWIFDKEDIAINIDDFDSGKCNLLFITGMSGSGKSTLSKEIQRQYDNSIIIELDTFQCYWFLSNNKNNNYKDNYDYKLVKEYLKLHPELDPKMFGNITLAEFEKYFTPFFNWMLYKLKKDKNHRFIINGIHIILFTKYKDIKKYPLYCINTSTIKSMVRHWIRDGWAVADFVKYGYDDILLFNTWNNSYDKFKKNII